MEGLVSAMTTAFATVASNVQDTIGGVLPIALGIMGTVLAIKFGIRFFRSIV